MKINNSFAHLAQKLKRNERGFRDPILMHPGREWWIGLVVAITILGVGASWSMQTYLTYREVTTTKQDVLTEEVVIYRETLVEAALAEFSERQKEHEELLAISKQRGLVSLPSVEVPVIEEGESLEEVLVATSSEAETETETETVVVEEGEVVLEEGIMATSSLLVE